MRHGHFALGAVHRARQKVAKAAMEGARANKLQLAALAQVCWTVGRRFRRIVKCRGYARSWSRPVVLDGFRDRFCMDFGPQNDSKTTPKQRPIGLVSHLQREPLIQPHPSVRAPLGHDCVTPLIASLSGSSGLDFSRATAKGSACVGSLRGGMNAKTGTQRAWSGQ